MPVYNGARYISQALDSLLAQDFADFEIVISDNASEDDTGAICRAYADRDPRIRYSRNAANLGAAPNYNRVFHEARGEYFKWASHDDTCDPTFLSRCVAALDEHRDSVIAFPRFVYVDENGAAIRDGGGHAGIHGESPTARVRQLFRHQIDSLDVYWAIFGLMRRSALEQTRLIESYLASDRTLLFHMTLLGDMLEVPECLFRRRQHLQESMVQQKSNRARARWFDTSKRPRRLYFPFFRLMGEHLALARRTLGFGSALRCYVQILWRFAHDWRGMAGEIRAVFRPSTWRG